MQIEIFRTNIQNESVADEIRIKLNLLFPHSCINFDLQDCDKILRIAGEDFNAEILIGAVNSAGIFCEILD